MRVVTSATCALPPRAGGRRSQGGSRQPSQSSSTASSTACDGAYATPRAVCGGRRGRTLKPLGLPPPLGWPPLGLASVGFASDGFASDGFASEYLATAAPTACDEGVSESGSAQRAGGGRLSGAGARKFGAPRTRLAARSPARARRLLDTLLLKDIKSCNAAQPDSAARIACRWGRMHAADGRFQRKALAPDSQSSHDLALTSALVHACQALLAGAHGAGPPRSGVTCARAARRRVVECARISRDSGRARAAVTQGKGRGGAQRADLSNHERLNRCGDVSP